MDGLDDAGGLLRSWLILACAKYNAAKDDLPDSAEEVDSISVFSIGKKEGHL